MTEPVVSDAPHGTASGYASGCRCGWCHRAGQHISADGTVEFDGSRRRPVAPVAGQVATARRRRP